MKRPALFQQQKQRCQLTLSSQFSLHHISICKGQGQAWWGFLFRKSSLQIKWDSFRFKEGRGEKERKSCRIYLMEKSYFSGWAVLLTEHQLKTGSILCLCSTVSSHKLWPEWPRLPSVPSFQPARAVPCLSPREGQWLTHQDVDSGIPQSHQWRRDRQLHPHTRTCDG